MEIHKKIVKRISKSKIFLGVFWPIVAALPPSLVELSDNKHAPEAVRKILDQFFNEHRLLRLMACSLWPFLITLIVFGGQKMHEFYVEAEELTKEQLSALLVLLDKVVGEKMDRFGKIAAYLVRQKEPQPAGKIFNEITRPSDQIKSLVESIWHAFLNDTAKDSSNSISVTLARMKKGHIDFFQYYAPEDNAPTTRAEDLRRRDSTFSSCAASGDIMVIEDIERELRKKDGRRFASAPSGTPSVGSMICFPIHHHSLGCVTHVISVKSSEKKHFKSAKRKRYKNVLQRFAKKDQYGA